MKTADNLEWWVTHCHLPAKEDMVNAVAKLRQLQSENEKLRGALENISKFCFDVDVKNYAKEILK